MSANLQIITPNTNGTLIIDNSAKNRINELCQVEKSLFRVEVIGGGCSGLQYKFGFDRDKDDKDIIIDNLVIVDQNSVELLADCTLSYIETLGSAYFTVINPNAKTKCGCGSSFSM